MPLAISLSSQTTSHSIPGRCAAMLELTGEVNRWFPMLARDRTGELLNDYRQSGAHRGENGRWRHTANGRRGLNSEGAVIGMVGQGGQVYARISTPSGLTLVRWGKGANRRCRVPYQFDMHSPENVIYLTTTCEEIVSCVIFAERCCFAAGLPFSTAPWANCVKVTRQ
ncbi:hypothetical protein LNQ03_10970 [Klebsiella pneumoniae subsp. pneumoniae]|nr:hypothetical protein [Klebsiella pneumoniae subsp. pneumoniae]